MDDIVFLTNMWTDCWIESFPERDTFTVSPDESK